MPAVRSTGVLAAAAAWVAFMTGVLLGRDVRDAEAFAIAALTGAAFVLLGYAAASRCRVLPPRVASERARLAVLSLVAGATLGLANLAANWAIAESDPALRQLLLQRFARIAPIDAIVAAPLLEEPAARLFIMSAIAWVSFRTTRRATPAFVVALVASSVIFAVAHLARPVPLDPALADYYRATLLVKYTPAGLLLGWIFWRWGLPYSILCHAAANAADVAVQSHVF